MKKTWKQRKSGLIQKTDIFDNAVQNITEYEDEIRGIDLRLKEIREAKRQMLAYAKTKNIYQGYVSSGYSKAYLSEYEEDIGRHKNAKEFFNKHGRLNAAELKDEYNSLIRRRKEVKNELYRSRQKMKELETIKANAEAIIGGENTMISTER